MPIGKNKKMLQISLPIEVYQRLKEYGERNGMTVAGTAVTFIMKQFNALDMTESMVKAIKNMTDDQLKEIMNESIPDLKKITE